MKEITITISHADWSYEVERMLKQAGWELTGADTILSGYSGARSRCLHFRPPARQPDMPEPLAVNLPEEST